MAMDAATLRRLSSLLDHAFELEPAAREAWLDDLAGDDAALAPLLRDLVGNGPSRVSSDRLAAAVRSGVLHTIDEERERGTIDGTVALVLRGLVAAAPLEWIRQILDGLTG